MAKIKKLIFWLAIAIITISIFALTIGQWLPVAFARRTIQRGFYEAMFTLFPLSILLTLAGTLKSRNTKAKNTSIVVFTIIMVIAGSFFMVRQIFAVGNGGWVNETIMYRHVDNPNHTINSQLLDKGALGYRDNRTVELTPLTPLFNKVRIIDATNVINHKEWRYVNEEGDIKWP